MNFVSNTGYTFREDVIWNFYSHMVQRNPVENRKYTDWPNTAFKRFTVKGTLSTLNT